MHALHGQPLQSIPQAAALRTSVQLSCLCKSHPTDVLDAIGLCCWQGKTTFNLLMCPGEAMSAPALQEIYVGPPSYQTDSDFFKLDLSCLVEDPDFNEGSRCDIEAVDVHAGKWPSRELQQLTPMDHSQLEALKVTRALLQECFKFGMATGHKVVCFLCRRVTLYANHKLLFIHG